MPRLEPAYRVKDKSVSQNDNVNLWAWASNESQRVYSNFVICVPPEINTHIVITFLTPKGELPITVSLSISGSANLFIFHYDIVAQLYTDYCELFQPYSCCQLTIDVSYYCGWCLPIDPL